MKALISAAALGVALAGSAAAQDDPDDEAAYFARFTQFENALHETRQSTVHWPIVFSRIDGFGERWEIVSFGRDHDRWRDWPRVWGARRLVGGAGIQQQEFIANSEDCPAITAALTTMERLTAPRIDIPSIGRDRHPTTAVMDGEDYRLWTAFGVYDLSQRATGAIEISGNVDTPLARWGDRTSAALETCWTPRASHPPP